MRTLTCLLLFSSFSLSAATTYYVSAAGSDLFTGTTQQAPWKTINRMGQTSLKSGDQVLFRRGDVWREMLNVPASGLTFGAYGTGARPVISGAALVVGWTSTATNVWSSPLSIKPQQIWFGGVLGINVASQQAVLGLNEWTYAGGKLYVYSTSAPGATQIEASQRDYALEMDSFSNETFQSIEFSKGNANTIIIGSGMTGTQTFRDVIWDGSPAEGIMALNGNLLIQSSIGQNNLYGLGMWGGTGLTLSGSVLSGNFDQALMVAGTTSSSTITGSTITGNATLNDATDVISNWTNHPMIASNSVLLGNPYLPTQGSFFNLTDDGTNVQKSPLFTSRAAPLIVVPYIDDYSNLAVAQAVANVASANGCHLTYALNTVFITAQDWPKIAALQASGHEIAAHTRTHPDLAYLNILTIQYTGTASTATLTINVPGRKIQSFLNGSTKPDLNITIPDYYPAGYLCNDIATTKGYKCSQPNQSWWTNSWASQGYFNPINLADVSGVNIKTAYTAKADPSRYYPYEIQGSKSDIETNIPGYKVATFATPFSSSSVSVETLIQGAGFVLSRNVLNDAPQEPTSFQLSHLNLYNIAAQVPDDIDGANVARSVDSLVEGLGASGGIFAFYSHGYDEFTLAQWTSFFSELKAVGATCMTASQAATYVKAHGALATDGSGKYWNSSIPLSPNYVSTGSSPAQGAHLQ